MRKKKKKKKTMKKIEKPRFYEQFLFFSKHHALQSLGNFSLRKYKKMNLNPF
jgi:hypothetical protein